MHSSLCSWSLFSFLLLWQVDEWVSVGIEIGQGAETFLLKVRGQVQGIGMTSKLAPRQNISSIYGERCWGRLYP